MPVIGYPIASLGHTHACRGLCPKLEIVVAAKSIKSSVRNGYKSKFHGWIHPERWRFSTIKDNHQIFAGLMGVMQRDNPPINLRYGRDGLKKKLASKIWFLWPPILELCPSTTNDSQNVIKFSSTEKNKNIKKLSTDDILIYYNIYREI